MDVGYSVGLDCTTNCTNYNIAITLIDLREFKASCIQINQFDGMCKFLIRCRVNWSGKSLKRLIDF